jgi:NAD(P)-dependent dehydrogenase (short-subunit alcohol dehydrogenase family)
MSKLDGKVGVITGGSLAAAKLFVDEGAYVFITGRRQAELDNAKALIGRYVTAIQGDVSKLDDLDRLFGQVRAEKGGLDTLATGAAFVEKTPMAAVTPEPTCMMRRCCRIACMARRPGYGATEPIRVRAR